MTIYESIQKDIDETTTFVLDMYGRSAARHGNTLAVDISTAAMLGMNIASRKSALENMSVMTAMYVM